MSLGFLFAGYQVAAAVEYSPDSAKTYRHNHAKLGNSTVVFERDIWDEDLEAEVQNELLRQGVTQLDVLTAGLPCETFSVAQRRRRSLNDQRTHLFRRVLQFVARLRPKVVLIENVPALESFFDGVVYTEIRESFWDLGYGFTSDVLDASNYGVPQKRRRLFMLAIAGRGRELPMPSLQEIPRVANPVSISEAIVDLPPLPPLSDVLESSVYTHSPEANPYVYKMRVNLAEAVNLRPSEVVQNHRAQKHGQKIVERFSLIGAGQNLKDYLKLHGHWLGKEKPVGYTRHRRPPVHEPSYTVTAHAADELLHPTVDRIVTPREAARIQSFPDWYEFLGPRSGHHGNAKVQDWYEQIGDAVPPLLARALALRLKELLLEL